MTGQTPASGPEGDGADEGVLEGSSGGDREVSDAAGGASGESTDAERETAPDAGPETARDAERGWLVGPWYRSGVGIGVVVADVLLTLSLGGVTIVGLDGTGVASGPPPGIVPWYVYAFSVLGALGFVFTALIEEFGRSTFEVLHYNFRLPAALPLGVGIYLFSDILLGETTADVPLVVGLVFLSGMYVNLAYRQLGALARRLLPGGREGNGRRGAETRNEDGTRRDDAGGDDEGDPPRTDGGQ